MSRMGRKERKSTTEERASSDEEEYSTQQGKMALKEVVKAILLLDHSKKPFKAKDIYACLSDQPSRKLSRWLIGEAEKSLKEMGMRLVDVDSASNTKAYFLVSQTVPLPFMSKFASMEEQADRTLLILVLAYILMKEGSVPEDELFHHLEKLNIYSEQHPTHEFFGLVKKKIMTEFVEQLYLQLKKAPGTETIIVSWGQRADLEVSKMRILEFVCQLGYLNKVKPENFVSQYQKITRKNQNEEVQPDAEYSRVEEDSD